MRLALLPPVTYTLSYSLEKLFPSNEKYKVRFNGDGCNDFIALFLFEFNWSYGCSGSSRPGDHDWSQL